MPANIHCLCLRCSSKPLLLRQVTPDLARKHLKRFGPAPLFPSTNGARSARTSRQSGLQTCLGNMIQRNRPSRPLEQDNLELDQGADDFGGFELDNDAHAIEYPQDPIANWPIRAPDNVYSHLQMPDGPDPSRDIEPADTASTVPLAYSEQEPSCVRIAYLQAVANNVFGNMSVKQTTDNLNMTLNALDAAGVLPEFPRPVRTLTGAKRRLGIDPDQWIVQYAICSSCWKHHTPKEVLDLATPDCSTPACTGKIYKELPDAKGRLKRYAIKILPQVSLLETIRRMVRRKGFRKLVRDSRGTPVHQNANENFVMTDMHDADIWHDLRTGIKREIGNYGTIRDTPLGEDTEHKLTDFRFGLHLSINLDWYVCLSISPLFNLTIGAGSALLKIAHIQQVQYTS
jgi:hypothetical protein